jgi:glycosyltransferase involved in cell wall biosynthesis
MVQAHTGKKLKIAMVVHDFPLQEGALDGGVAAAAFYLCSALRDTGEIELDIVRPFAPSGIHGTIEVAGLRVHALNFPPRQPKNFHSLCTVRTLVREKLRQLRPDVVHVQNHTVIAGGLPPEQTVLSIHGIWEKDVLYRGRYRLLKSKLIAWLERSARRRVRYFISISPYTRQQLTPSPSYKFWDIANPVSLRYFDVLRRPRPGVIFSAARISELKNTQGLIRAFADVAQTVPQAELRLAGSWEDANYMQQCKKLASSLGAAGRVKFLGILNVNQILNELAEADCFALCSFQENAPVAIGEAMAAGVPVLASAVGGVAYMVENGVTGRLVTPQDNGSITKALADLLIGDNRSVMGAAGKAKALSEYHSTAVARRTIAVYQEISQKKT